MKYVVPFMGLEIFCFNVTIVMVLLVNFGPFHDLCETLENKPPIDKNAK